MLKAAPKPINLRKAKRQELTGKLEECARYIRYLVKEVHDQKQLVESLELENKELKSHAVMLQAEVMKQDAMHSDELTSVGEKLNQLLARLPVVDKTTT